MKNPTILVVTYFYNSCNFGGCLQAYALCRFLNTKGACAEQLSFDYDYKYKHNQKVNTTIMHKLKHRLDIGFKKSVQLEKDRVLKYIDRIYLKKYIEEIKKSRKIVFGKFREELVPHTQDVYNYSNANECVDNYDVFLTGSDQVWNIHGYNPGFFLDFVPSTKKKISYAASIAKDSLTEEEKNIFRNSLKDYDAVSVREENAVDMIKDLSPVMPQFVVDPVLLLGREEWDVLDSGRKYDEPYVLCYFLGKNKHAMKLAKKFARKNKMKTVVIPMLTNRFSISSRKIADEKVIDASPQDFVSMIKNAEYVFTDSFHACVFSSIYNKEFFAFNRDREGTMNSRIVSLLDMFGIPERFCDTKDKERLSYIESLNLINYKEAFEKFKPIKEESEKFLIDNIGLN